jgi:tetratricopeptide (TPR) repeat protein
MRSLGSIHFSSRDYTEAIPCFEKALAISPLYSRVWFTLGVSFVRLERWSEARDAFQRVVGVTDDDAEGWNNLAAVYLRLDEEGLSEGAVSYFNPPPIFAEWYRLHHL